MACKSIPAYMAATQDLAREWYVDPNRRAQFKALLAEHGLVRDFVSEVYRHKTRERIWVRVHAHAVRDATGAVGYYEGTVEDITVQRRAQLETEANERRFRVLTEKAVEVGLRWIGIVVPIGLELIPRQ